LSRDRTSPNFWTRVAHDQGRWIRTTAHELVSGLVSGIGDYKRARGSTSLRRTEDKQLWVDHADATVQAWMQYGIPRGPVRAAYEQVNACMQDGFHSDAKECVAAELVIHDPPAAPAAATSGGKLILHLESNRLSGPPVVEIDGHPVKVTGEDVTVELEVDGEHKIHVTAPRMKTFDRTVDVRYGTALKVVVPMLPK